jgi:hypothetical protein
MRTSTDKERVEITMPINNTTVLLSGNVSKPTTTTPADVDEYLKCMGWHTHWGTDGIQYWRRDDRAGYFTWAEAVTYTMVKPFLVKEKA